MLFLNILIKYFFANNLFIQCSLGKDVWVSFPYAKVRKSVIISDTMSTNNETAQHFAKDLSDICNISFERMN